MAALGTGTKMDYELIGGDYSVLPNDVLGRVVDSNLRRVGPPQWDAKEIEFEVRDDGVGIAPELLPRMFEPFLTTKESGKGVGWGLAVSRSIVERHTGKIEVQSEVGKGTTFVVRLPLGGKEPLAVAAAVTAGRQAR